MSKIIAEVKVNEDAIPLEEIFQELKQKDYSKEIMIRPFTLDILFDKTEDLVRFAEFVHQYQK